MAAVVCEIRHSQVVALGGARVDLGHVFAGLDASNSVTLASSPDYVAGGAWLLALPVRADALRDAAPPGEPAWERHCLLWRDGGWEVACRRKLLRAWCAVLPLVAAPSVPLPPELLHRKT